MKEIFSKMSLRTKAWLAVAAVFVFLAFVDRLILDPTTVRLHQLDQEIKTDEGQLAQYLRYMNQRDPVTAEYKKYSAYVRKSGSDEEEQTKISGEIEALARKTNVSIANMKSLAPRTVDFYKRYEVELEAEGEMESLTNFLYQISNSPQLLRTEKVRFNLKEKDSTVVKGYLTVTKVVMP